MKKSDWQDWIRRELTQDHVAPASEDFYHGIWNRIRAAERTSSIHSPGRPLSSIGLACWRAVPVLAALLLTIALYAWFYPPDFRGEIPTSIESYVLDADDDPSNTTLFYQIMHPSHASELEAEP